jgi:uncharacterized repeat protein (TIGR03803 family)
MRVVSLWAGCAAVFAATAWDGAAAAEKVLFSFNGGHNGFDAYAGVIVDAQGALFGTTEEGGARSSGVAYRLTPPAQGATKWTETVLASFSTRGRFPFRQMIEDAQGNFFGTTVQGGFANEGVSFELTPPSQGQTKWTEKALTSFEGGGDGSYPYSRLAADGAGNLYGTTNAGGGTGCNANGCGTVFMLSPQDKDRRVWAETVLYAFQGGSDGKFPYEGVAIDSAGNLYGATNGGGVHGFGTVFELTPPPPGGKVWTETLLYAFSGGTDGTSPYGGVLVDANGNLFGTTTGGGVGGAGTVYEVSPPAQGGSGWTETVLQSFDGLKDGGGLTCDLLADRAGNLFGTTTGGGDFKGGTAFRLAPPAGGRKVWKLSLLHAFGNKTDGQQPWAGLAADGVGNLYGTTLHGGRLGAGTVFQLTNTGYVP